MLAAMTHITTVPPAAADGPLRDTYAALQASLGYVPAYATAFSLRPEVYAAWTGLIGTIRASMDQRRYELVTLAAARALRSSYCSLAHATILAAKFHTVRELALIASDPGAAREASVLDPTDAAIMAFSAKVAREAPTVTAEDVQVLRDHGLTDPEIFDVAAAASARCFFSTLLDALGARPDAAYRELAEELRDELVVGRPVDDRPVERL